MLCMSGIILLQVMRKTIVQLILVLAAYTNLYAQQRTRTECAQLAMESGYVKYPIEVEGVSSAKAKIAGKVYTPYCIYNDSISDRFVIISGDRRMQPILGYGEGNFNPNEIPAGLVDMLDSYSDVYEFIQNVPFEDNQDSKILTSGITTPIVPLISSKWGQDIPFNNNTPRLGKYERTASGCVATAMAQIMKYYNYPSSGKGFYSYTTETHGLSVQEDFSQTRFEWWNMLHSYRGNFSQIEGTAVATLMKSCGVSVSMDYDNSSGAYSSDVPYALINNFGYNPNVQYYAKQYFSDEEWENIILNELRNGRPMLYSATDADEGGHAFILDGVDANGLFHFNWGWEGSNDGYFAINALTPRNYRYNSNHAIVCHIQPEEAEQKEDVFFASSFNCSQFEASVNDRLQFFLNSCYCYANTTSYSRHITANWDLSVGIFDSHDNLVQTGEIVTRSGEAQKNVGSFYLSIKPNLNILNPDLTYYIKPIVSQSGSQEYSVVRTSGGENNQYKLTVRGYKFSINDQLESVFSENGINYMISSTSERTVTATKGDYHFSVNVPKYVMHDGIEYTTTAIGSKSFMQCYDLYEVTLPSTIQSVGSWCFDGCTSLERIVCYAPTPPVCEFYVTYPFDDVVSTAILYVPMGSKEEYLKAEGWCNFNTIIEFEEAETSLADVVRQNEPVTVFSVNGLELGRINANEVCKQLPPGLYIINGKKYLINDKHSY